MMAFLETMIGSVSFMNKRRYWAIGIVAASLVGLTAPAAASSTKTRLVSCGTQSCLLVTGHRESVAVQVSINGHPLDVKGGRSWKAVLPIATVRGWSMPFDRGIEVATLAPTAPEPTLERAVLPIGLLGHAPDLASLVITLH
jgi:hypothetical protein